MVPAVQLFETVILLIGVFLCVLGYLSDRWWDEPGSTMFGVFVAGWGLLPLVDTVLVAFQLVQGVTGFLWVLTTVPWCLFALEYTGREFETATVVVLLVPSLGLVPWLVTEFATSAPGSVFQAVGILVFTYYTALSAAGAMLILWTARRYAHLSYTQGGLLALAGFVPPATMNAFGVLFEPLGETVAFGLFAVGSVVSCLAVFLALFRYDVFDSTPAAGTLGKAAVARETDDLIVIADDDDEVIMRNRAATETLLPSGQGVIGRPIGQVIGVETETLRTQETVELQTDQGVRQFDSQVTALTDQHERQIGTMVSLRDVTEREIRRQRLEVLNRIVRHNLRNQASVIKANTEAVADELDDDELLSYLDSATDSVDELTDLGEKAKTVEELLERDTDARARIDLGSFLDEVAAESADRWSTATITASAGDNVTVETDGEILRFVLSNLIENAVEHAESNPTIELRICFDPDGNRQSVIIEVTDDGPGIPDREIEVIEAGTETPLKHGSGVGLWVTNWAVRELGGELVFPERGPEGSTVQVRLPHEPQTAQSERS